MERIFEYVDCVACVKGVATINVYDMDKITGEEIEYTIAIPTYKRADSLSETLESALSQKDFDNYHVIVVDNNPVRGDETELLMEKYKAHPKVSYYKNSQNLGMAGNWNKCLLLSPSNCVVLLHDDDIMSPYCLFSFDKIKGSLANNWAMVKPNTIKFGSKEDLHFKKPHILKLYKLISYHFYDSCPIGAPTVILLNKDVIIKMGGYNQDYYPSFDYLMSARASLFNSLYLAVYDQPQGGYRIGKNESLSEKTMDRYYEMRYMIADSYCSQKHVPRFLSKLIHSIRNEACVKSDTSYYNMSNYVFKGEKFKFWKFPDRVNKILTIIYINMFRLPVFLNRKTIEVG